MYESYINELIAEDNKNKINYEIPNTLEEISAKYPFLSEQQVHYTRIYNTDFYIRSYYINQEKQKKLEEERISQEAEQKRLEKEKRKADEKRIEAICSKLTDATPEKIESLIQDDYPTKWQLLGEEYSDKINFFETIAEKYNTLLQFEKTRQSELQEERIEQAIIKIHRQHRAKHIAWEKRKSLLVERMKNCGADIQTETGLRNFLNRNFGNFKTEDSFDKEVFRKSFYSTTQFKIFYGNNGAGKTHLAISIAQRKLKKSFCYHDDYYEKTAEMDSFLFITAKTLTTEYRKCNYDFNQNFDEYIAKIVRNNSLVIVDEVGQSDDEKESEKESSALYQLIDSCANNGIEVILCTNINEPTTLMKFLTQRTTSRLRRSLDLIQFNGKDHRLDRE